MSIAAPARGPALVSYGPLSERQWKLETVHGRELRNDEVLVRVLASGICLADIHVGDAPAALGEHAGSPVYYPRVLGHEGCGYVVALGASVCQFDVGDPVLLSFNSCGKCYACDDGHPAHCADMFNLNFVADRKVYRLDESDEVSVGGSFFGQSSFASRAVVKAACVVNLRGLVDGDEDLKFLAPLGCGIQTGSAAMLNIGGVKSGQDVCIIGAGGVGLSAIMVSHMQGCRRIIAIDRNESRLQMARSLGATHTINNSDQSIDLTHEVRKIADGHGVHVSLDTTGVRDLARASYDFVRNGGKIIPVGLSKPEDCWEIPMLDLMNSGKQILGCVQGDVIPNEYALDMIRWQKAGLFPFEKIITLYNAADFERALEDMREGKTVKPVLVWPS